MNNYSTMLFYAAAAMLIAGCGTASPKQVSHPAALPPAGSDGQYRVSFPTPRPAEDRMIRMTLSKDAYVECRFSPHFAYNSVEPLPQDRIALQKLAGCLNEPDARSHGIVLIGRTDVRGSSDYNARLGRNRAARVRDLLIHEGVDRNRIRIASHGEHGAKGFAGDYSHGYDRRVDVMLDGTSHIPDTRERSLQRAEQSGQSLRDARRAVALAAGQRRIEAGHNGKLLAVKR